LFELVGMNDCRTMRAQKSFKQKRTVATTGLIGGLLTGGAAGAAMMVGGVAAAGSMTLIENITADDTM
jgi:cyanophycinase-like exopeptidase